MNKTKKIVILAMYVALCIVLDYIKEFLPFLNMPFGGSINIALIPLCVCSFHIGYKEGTIVGFVWWLISFCFGLNRWWINIPQYLLDYIIPSIIIGLSSIFYKKKTNLEIISGISLMMLIRTLSITLSGAVYWVDSSMIAGSKEAWIASFAYNVPYSLCTLIVLLVVCPIIISRINKIEL